MNSNTGVLVVTAVAAAMGIASGLGAAWMIYSQHLPKGNNYWGLAPSAISILVYVVFVAMRFSAEETAVCKVVLAGVGGLFILIAIESIPILMIGCCYGECINL